MPLQLAARVSLTMFYLCHLPQMGNRVPMPLTALTVVNHMPPTLIAVNFGSTVLITLGLALVINRKARVRSLVSVLVF